MIEGITILAQEEIFDIGFFSVYFALVIPSIAGLIFGLFLDNCMIEDYFWGIGAVIGILIGLCFVAYMINNAKPTGEYTYKVTIDETVSLTEFYERYEIIEHDGLIYEIKERMTSND